MASDQLKRIIIYGGSGALGRKIVENFNTEKWLTISIDLVKNDSANENVIIEEKDDWCKQGAEVNTKLSEVLGSQKVDAISCVAGGWAGGNAAADVFIQSCDLMWKQSVWSSTISANIASKFLKEGGFLQLTGAVPSLDATPGMMGYGLAKAAVHQLTKSLADPEKSGLPENSSVLAILPITLDTPMNRKFMAGADFSTWTSLEFVADTVFGWSTDGASRPKSGSLIKLVTKSEKTDLVPV